MQHSEKSRAEPNAKIPLAFWKRFGAAATLCAAGVLLTWAAQRFSLSAVLLPYQLPVLLSGYLLPMSWAFSCAVATPVLCSVLLGFPGAMIMLPLVTCQMIAIAAFASFLYTMLNMNPIGVWFLSVAFGYVILFCAAAIYGAVSADAVQPVPYVRNTLVRTWPGLLLDLLAPAAVYVCTRIRARKASSAL